MRSRGLVVLAVAVVAALALASCALPGGTSPTDAARTDTDPVDLVDEWVVTGADGEAPGTRLLLEDGGYRLARACGEVGGAWAASDDGTFVATAPGSATGRCGSEPPWPTADWLSHAVAVERTAHGWHLRDAGGAVLATLTADRTPTPGRGRPAKGDLRPEGNAAPLPWSLIPATRQTLVGRWVPAGDDAGAHVDLAADGTYTGFDGCNHLAGVWAVGGPGGLLADAGSVTLMACEGRAVDPWPSGSARAGFTGGVLVILDRAGAELGRLTRD